MKTLNLFVSLNTFNNQTEYEAYKALPEEDTAEDDFSMPNVLVLTVGYYKIVMMTFDNDAAKVRKIVMNRRKHIGADFWDPRSIAVNGKALVMHGPDFIPFSVVLADNEDGFEIVYRKEGAE